MTERHLRSSGMTTGEEVAQEQAEELEVDPFGDDRVVPEERKREFEGVNFARLRLDWRGDDGRILDQVRTRVDQVIAAEFADVTALRYEVWDIVRTQAVDPDTGELRVDEYGAPVFKLCENGTYEEDWSRLTDARVRELLFRVVTGLYEWEQRAADLWFEAMFAKWRWTTGFAQAFDQASGVVDARTARANLLSEEDRLFAIFRTYLSRRAEAVVRSMRAVEQRLKDALVSG